VNEIIEQPDRRPGSRGLRLALGTRSRRWWTGATLAIGALIGSLIAAVVPPEEVTFALVCGPVQLLMSATLPFVGALLMTDVRRARVSALPAVRAALVLAVGVAGWGVVVSAIAVAVAGPAAPGDTWRYAPQIACGSVLVLVVAQGSGLAFGAVIRRPWLACLATFSPLPAWGLLVLAGVSFLSPWLTPFGNAPALLAGDTPIAWLREAVVAGVWGALLSLVRVALRRPAERVEEVQ
jgi:hypothetical protein